MNPIVGQQYRFKDISEKGPAEGPQAPNVYTVTAVTDASVYLIQVGSKEPTLFRRANFERDFEPLAVS